MSAETIRTVKDGEPRMATSSFTQLQTSDGPLFVKPFLYLPVSMSHPSCETTFGFGTKREVQLCNQNRMKIVTHRARNEILK